MPGSVLGSWHLSEEQIERIAQHIFQQCVCGGGVLEGGRAGDRPGRHLGVC